MHSSRMRTVRWSGRLPGVAVFLAREGVSARGGCLPCVWGGVRPGGSARGRVSAWPVAEGGVHLPPVDRILHTCLWKHYLSPTSFADGNNRSNFIFQHWSLAAELLLSFRSLVVSVLVKNQNHCWYLWVMFDFECCDYSSFHETFFN